ncbi:hypothetical protein EJV47_23310 [Hymenobacter gummosus]|uniref:Uncharacterized protein n=1 Tax=Hymenobacter gummosus TaxID=1776032 RepID=A0A3S0H1T8_9BACT|nr:hypothetical protein [Hymenobacter gummosus]RTQ46083.1 hypothetical protein EJV47_23310 [Hymenobacter gummosus]
MRMSLAKSVFLCCLITSCHNQKMENIGSSTAEKADVTIDGLPYDASANTTNDIPFQDSVDVLQNTWLRSESDTQLEELESLAVKSDGEASDYLCTTLKIMFKEKPAPLIIYLDKNRNSALYGVLTDGLGVSLVVYNKEERITEKQQLKVNAIKSSNGKLSKKQIDFIDRLFEDVSPEKFD